MREACKEARRIQVGGIVQGVGFRPFVYRLADEFGITGWVLNGERGVEIHAEGDAHALDGFERALVERPPPAAKIAEFDTSTAELRGFSGFEIHRSVHHESPTVRVSPDLPICDDCLRELFDPGDRRYGYPYINCTNCGPRYSIVHGLPYDRPNTTMRNWPMCDRCRAEYENPLDRRFHAQPIACFECGPNVVLEAGDTQMREGAITQAAAMLANGRILAVKGIGGYHLACDARNAGAVRAMRERKYRKERPFALLARSIEVARTVVEIGAQAQAVLQSQARPIVLVPAVAELEGVAPDNRDLGIMLPYTPVHHLLFAAGAPELLVMTSANRSSEPIAYRDEDARRTLTGMADAFLIGEREIARRIDDSVFGATVIRHARGLAPQAASTLPTSRPIVAVGADLKNAVAVVVRGQAFISQHIGDLEHYEALQSFKETIEDLQNLYELPRGDVLIAHDAHPEYASTSYAAQLQGEKFAVQHHRAHIASVLAEHEAFDTRVLGFAFDGTGYGEDGTIWGGEVFVGDLASGLQRVAHLRPAKLPGGDAAARFPLQAAAGFLDGLSAPCHREPVERWLSLSKPTIKRFELAKQLLEKNVRVFQTTSVGRLFDTVAALLGFTRRITFEAQAAMWVEHLARGSAPVDAYPFPFENSQLDYRPLLEAIVADRARGRDIAEIARAFHEGLAAGVLAVCAAYGHERVVVSGGVFQNALLLARLQESLGNRLWTNRITPPNDGGICLGQAAIASIAAAR